MYKISIILPVYNVEKYIEIGFNSILNQTIGFENLEVIFVDDCSTDDSAKIIQSFSNKYDNVKYYCLDENSGAAGKPRNFGIEKSQSEYIMFLDPDDVFFDDACEKLYNFIIGEDLDIVSGGYVEVNGEKEIKNDWGLINLDDGKIRLNSINENYNLLRFPASVWSKIFKKSLIIDNNIKFPVGVPAQDLYFVSHYLLKAKGILFVDFPVVKYLPRQGNGGSMTSKRDKKTLSSFIKVYNDLSSLLKEFDEDCSWIAAVNLYFWTNIFLSSDLNVKDKIDLLRYAHDLFVEFKNSPYLRYKVGYEQFFEAVCDNNYSVAIEESNKIVLRENFKDIIKSHDILMLFFGFDLEIGGLARAVFNRANYLSRRGYNVTLLNIDSFKNDNIHDNFKNFKFIESYFKDLNFLDDSVNVLNMFDYFSKINTIDFKNKHISEDCRKINYDFGDNLLDVTIKLNDSCFIYGNYIIERSVTDDQQIIFNYFSKYHLKNEIKSMYNYNELVFIKNFTPSDNFTPLFREIYIDGYLCAKININENNAELYTSDGFIYCSINQNLNNDYNLEFNLNDRNSFCSYPFNYKELYGYFTYLFCLGLDSKPFLIDDCPGPRPSIFNIGPNLAYKIANIHCNHHNAPFNFGSSIKKLGAFENMDELNAIVFLTDSQKNDFKKECGFDKCYDISNFIPDEELKKLNVGKMDKDYCKVSVFARVSPEKNLSDIIKAFKKVVEVKNDAILEIFGRILINWEIKEHNKLLNLIKEFGIEDNVIFRGHVDNVDEEMSNSLVTLFTSEAEGLGLVVIESMANGTPVISYDLNYGPRNIITNNKDGFLVEQGNIDKLSEKIIYLLDNPSKAIEMGKIARQKIIDKFSADYSIDKWESVFEEIYVNDVNNYCVAPKFEELELSHGHDEIINHNSICGAANLLNENKELKLKLNNLEQKILDMKECNGKFKEHNSKFSYILNHLK